MLAYIYNKVKTQVAKLTAPLSSREGRGRVCSFLFITFLFITSSLLFSSCGAETNIKKGDALYAIGEYFDAAAEYKKGYSRTAVKDKPKRGERAWKMAECYRHINFTAKAIGAYQNAIRYKYPDSMAVLYLAQMQHKRYARMYTGPDMEEEDHPAHRKEGTPLQLATFGLLTRALWR